MNAPWYLRVLVNGTAKFHRLFAAVPISYRLKLHTISAWGGDLITQSDITQLIAAYRDGDESAYDQVVELLYPDLRQLAHRQLARYHGNATMQTTAVVNEAYLKLKNAGSIAVDREHFLGMAAKTMRHVIIDYARKRMAEKRGGDQIRVTLQDNDLVVAAQAEQLILIDDALKKISQTSEQMVRVFECKFFAELGDDEVAATLGISKRTAQREWMKVRGLLAEYIGQANV